MAVAAATVLTFHSRQAAAYCRTHTCDPSQELCDVENGCIISGHPLFWPTSCTSFGVHSAGSPLRGISFEQASTIITASYQKWISVDCGEARLPGIKVATKGEIECGKPEYNQSTGNANVWIFRDTDWPYQSQFATLALTTITFNTLNGEIYDADVEINSHNNQITIGDEMVLLDLESIVTHETGHFFGLSHSSVPGSTMIAEYRAGETAIRSLDADDQAGMCAIYPPDRQAPDNKACAPRHGFSRTCASAKESTCSTVPAVSEDPESTGQHWFTLGLFGLALGLVARRRGMRRMRAGSSI
jgi:hypothetical protein